MMKYLGLLALALLSSCGAFGAVYEGMREVENDVSNDMTGAVTVLSDTDPPQVLLSVRFRGGRVVGYNNAPNTIGSVSIFDSRTGQDLVPPQDLLAGQRVAVSLVEGEEDGPATVDGPYPDWVFGSGLFRPSEATLLGFKH